MIMGMNILHNGSVSPRKRKVKVGREWMPITITLKEMQQHSVIATVNRVIQPFSRGHTFVPAEIIRDNMTEGKNRQRITYIVNSGGNVVDGQLIESRVANTPKGMHEYVRIGVENTSNKKKIIRKGDLLATVETLNEAQISAITPWTQMKIIENQNILAASIIDCWKLNPANPATHGPNINYHNGVDSTEGYRPFKKKGREACLSLRVMEDSSIWKEGRPSCRGTTGSPG